MSKVVLILAMTGIAGFLLRLSVRGEKKRKYDRKPQTPWAKLNDDVDPSL
jgi:hypothetical protein